MACAAFLAACGGGERAARPPDVLLVTLDTVRADRLGCYGYAGGTTPFLDRIAAEGLRMDQAIAVAPLTLPSHTSILTGLYPPRHGVRDNADFRLGASGVTLAERFRERGYFTAAAVGSLVLASSQGLNRGFDVYDEPSARPMPVPRGVKFAFRRIGERRAAEVTDAALRAVERSGDRPFFLWVHYFDPHSDYDPPQPWSERFASRPYDGEIAYTDAEIGRLLERLEARGRSSDMLVAVVADHGEGLGEHGETTHGVLLYEATLRVPLLLRWPGRIPPGTRVREPASGVDLAPTMLDLLGLPPMEGAQGRSFAAAARGGEIRPRGPLYSESLYGEHAFGWARLLALREGTVKLLDAPEPEIYDLAEDPSEKHDLAPASPGEVRERRERLRNLIAEIGPETYGSPAGMDADRRALLESLGYVSAGGPAAGRRDRPNPNRLMAAAEAYLDARRSLSLGRLEEAEKMLRRVLAADPGNPAALALDGAIQVSLGRREEGIARLERAVRAAPGVYENVRNLADAYHTAGRLDEAAEAWRAALGIQPESAEARFALGNVLFAKSDDPGAIASYREALRLDPGWAPALAALGVAYERGGDAEAALASLREAVAADPGFFEAWNRLGVLEEKRGRLAEARAAYEGGLEARPGDAGLLFNHAKACLRLGDLAAARASGERLLAGEASHPAARFLLASILESSGDAERARALLREFVAQPGADPRLVAEAREKLGGMAP